jgi:hypothetical protein
MAKAGEVAAAKGEPGIVEAKAKGRKRKQA